MQEILKTPNRPLHKLLLLEITKKHTLSCRFHFKFLATWQKELKCWKTFEMTPMTNTYLKQVVNNEMITYISTLQTRQEKLQLVPILTKFGGPESQMEAL
jgi:hypothetical protein